MIEAIRKYPRTHHLEGSRYQPGDDDLDAVALASLGGGHVVIEEKMDGANSALSFTAAGELRLQSRGHYLTGGARERHFDLFKRWAFTHRDRLWDLVADRYVVYGEWLYAKHTVFYDQLPHYFLEFDILDRRADQFLSTPRRHELLADSPLVSVPVLLAGAAPERDQLHALVAHSLYKSARWREELRAVARRRELDEERVVGETDPADEMEGLYVKVEEGDVVTGRYKYVRASFLTSVLDSGSHWLSRPIVANQLAAGVDIFAAQEGDVAG